MDRYKYLRAYFAIDQHKCLWDTHTHITTCTHSHTYMKMPELELVTPADVCAPML